MSNVLPPAEKKRVNRVYRARYLQTGALLTVVVCAIIALAFLPAYLALRQAVPPPVSKQNPAGAADLSAIARTQSLLQTLDPLFAATTTPADLVDIALELRTPQIHIDHITYASGKAWTITLSGSADTPNALGAYKNALEKKPLIAKVDVPVGALVGAEGKSFSMTITGQP